MVNKQAIALSYEDIEKIQKEWIETVANAPIDFKRKVIFGIVNKSPECSDTWEFEVEDE